MNGAAWLGTSPEEPQLPLLDDGDDWRGPRWWERFAYPGWTEPHPNDVDRLLGPMYRMWEEQR